jgi:ABC-type branched-subunit amino acid transport system ATPase component
MATLLRRIRADGVTILMVEHVMRLIMELCDRLSVLQFGELIAHGDAASVAKDERVREAYLGHDYVL